MVNKNKKMKKKISVLKVKDMANIETSSPSDIEFKNLLKSLKMSCRAKKSLEAIKKEITQKSNDVHDYIVRRRKNGSVDLDFVRKQKRIRRYSR